METSPQTRMVVMLAVALLIPNEHNPRDLSSLSDAEKSDLLALGTSMVRDGQKQPVRCVKRGEQYVLVSGHRRWLAAKLVNMRTLSAIVLDREPTEAELLLDQIVENQLRDNLSPIGLCEAYQALMKLNGWSVKALAEAVHSSEAQVSKTLTLKRLCEELREKVRAGELKGSNAYLIARVGNPETQKALAAENLTRDALEARVKGILKGTAKARGPKPTTLGTALEKTSAGLEKVKTWAKDVASEIDRLMKLNLDPAAVADTILKRFGKGGMRSNTDLPNPFECIDPANSLILGSTRSGKTTSTGRALIRTWLGPGEVRRRWFRRKKPVREPPGMLALTVKVNESENIALTAHLAGRGLDVIRVCEGGEYGGDPLSCYLSLPGTSAASAAKFLAELTQLVTRTSGHSNDPFWERQGERTHYFALVILKAAYRYPTFETLYRFLSTLPYGPEDMKDTGGFHLGEASKAAKLAVQNVKPADEAELKRSLEWMLTEFVSTPDKLRESVRQQALSVVFPATQEPLAGLFRGSGLTPDLLNDGKIVILDLPVLKYGAAGAIYQGAFKCVFDTAMIQRGRGARTCLRWTDECQWLLLPDWDQRIATVSSESNYFQVNLTQTIPTMLATLGGEAARHQVASLLANSPLKCFHWTDDYETGELASRLCGTQKELMFGGSTGAQGYDLADDLMGVHKSTASVSYSTQYNPVFRGEELMKLRRGGKDGKYVCDCLLTLAGHAPRLVAVPQTLI